jgi:hypothetical protein
MDLAQELYNVMFLGGNFATSQSHIGKLHCTERYNILNTYIVSSDVGSVDGIEVSMYVYVCNLTVSK